VLDINVSENTVFSSFLTPTEESSEIFPNNHVVRREAVVLHRLDDIIEPCLSEVTSPRIYLKLDTQGFDLEVVKGGTKVLPNILGLQTEVSFRGIYYGMPSFMESISEFLARGFDVVGFLPVTSDGGKLSAIEMDCVMVRRQLSKDRTD
jgi:hypothetical protein